MPYFTEAQLREFASSRTLNESAQRIFKAEKEAEVTIFLSHSHHDRELARGFRNHLGSIGISLYIDLEDSDMPESTNIETAERIKGKIKSLDYFLVLATANAMQSRWVPWEIGVADGYKPSENIAVVPVEDSSGHFYGNEYLQLYRRLHIADNKRITAVFKPNQTKGITAKEWLQGN